MGEQVAAGLYGGLAQLGEHLPCKQGVESSNLLVSTIAMVLFVATIFRTYLENRILKIQERYQSKRYRHPRSMPTEKEGIDKTEMSEVKKTVLTVTLYK